MTNAIPTENDAAEIISMVMGVKARTVKRFTTGSQHFVYDILTEAGDPLVARIARPENRRDLHGALYWSKHLRPAGVPLPELLHDGVDTGYRFPFIILARIPGTDLGHVYGSLAASDKQEIASRIADIQSIAAGLPAGDGYGFVHTPGEPFPHRTWGDVVREQLGRSRSRIAAAGILDPAHVDRVELHAENFGGYFSRIPPRPFLDDTTTKNVIIHEGRLSGIVDVDMVCYGDPLFPVALTRMALLSRGYDTDYITYWCGRIGITAEQEWALQFYTALFCVDFMGELGQRFNREHANPVDDTYVLHLTGILDKLLDGLRGSLHRTL